MCNYEISFHDKDNSSCEEDYDIFHPNWKMFYKETYIQSD